MPVKPVSVDPAGDPSARKALTVPLLTGRVGVPADVTTPEIDAVPAALAVDAGPDRLIDDATRSTAATLTSPFTQRATGTT